MKHARAVPNKQYWMVTLLRREHSSELCITTTKKTSAIEKYKRNRFISEWKLMPRVPFH